MTFTSKTVAGFLRSLELVETLLRPGGPDLILPLHGEEGYEAALNVVQNSIKEDWVREARVKWLEACIIKWENYTNFHISEGDLKDLNGIEAGCELGVRLSDIVHYLQISYLGAERLRLMRRFMEVLMQWHKKGVQDDYARALLIQLINRQTGCERQNDPHGDPLLRDLLVQHYGIVS